MGPESCAFDAHSAPNRRLGFYQEAETRPQQFRCYFAMGKIRGTLRMRNHISAYRATTKYFSNSFVFKSEIEKEGLPRDRRPDLGAGGPGFKSRRPDQPLPCVSAILNRYQFFNVPADVFNGLMNAASKEGYYHSKIGERFPCSRVW